MPSYIAEFYVSRARLGEVSSLTNRARDAARALAEEGHEVAYVRAASMPEDEVCVLWFIAPSPAIVSELGRLAKLQFDRVVEELEQQPSEEPCAHEPA